LRHTLFLIKIDFGSRDKVEKPGEFPDEKGEFSVWTFLRGEPSEASERGLFGELLVLLEDLLSEAPLKCRRDAGVRLKLWGSAALACAYKSAAAMAKILEEGVDVGVESIPKVSLNRVWIFCGDEFGSALEECFMGDPPV